MRTPAPGGVRLRRFLLIAAPATGAALMLVPAILLGWVSVAIASSDPIGIAVSSGTAGSVYISASTNQRVVPHNPEQGDSGVALLNVTDGVLADLCLALDIDLPLLPQDPVVRLRSVDTVHIGEITLAASDGVLDNIDLPATGIGFVDGGSRIPGASESAFSIRTIEGSTRFRDLHTDTLALVLDRGVRLDALRLRAGLEGGC